LIFFQEGVVSYIPKLFFTVAICFLWSSPVSAGSPIHGARAAGMGTAFIGLADDPSALLHNPAGITQLSGSQIYTGVTVLAPASEYSSTRIKLIFLSDNIVNPFMAEIAVKNY